MKWKAVIGIILAVASLAGLYLWETKFEDEITLTPVIVLTEDHLEGDTILISDLKIQRINPESKIENALTEADVSKYVGKVLNQDVYKNQQLVAKYFTSKENVIPEGYVNFVIPNDWIYSKSSLICERDYADIFAMPEKVLLGSYRIDVMNDSSVEIIAKLDDYFKIYDAITVGNNKLLIVMENN